MNTRLFLSTLVARSKEVMSEVILPSGEACDRAKWRQAQGVRRGGTLSPAGLLAGILLAAEDAGEVEARAGDALVLLAPGEEAG